MDGMRKLLSGSDLIKSKINEQREIPTAGWKEFHPSNTWLEKKQIQNYIEDKYKFISSERIEKSSNLAKAIWDPKLQKARVVKQIGKYWEVFGHHQDNEDWLLPEEALYLMEINVLELQYGDVPVSVEQSYFILLGDNCNLDEYRVFSYLSRRGYKIIRHAKDVKVTQYEKQIHLSQIVESQKRSVPGVSPQPMQYDKEKNTLEIDDDHDVCIIEDSVEVIEIEDNTDNVICSSSKKQDDVIVIDESDESEDVDSDSIEEVIFVPNVISRRLKFTNSRAWYLPCRCCLIPTEIDLVDGNEELINSQHFKHVDFFDLGCKTKEDILKEMASVKSGGTTINSPDRRFIPKTIEPRHAVYRVNLNMRDMPDPPTRTPRRIFYSSNTSWMRPSSSNNNNNVFNNNGNNVLNGFAQESTPPRMFSRTNVNSRISYVQPPALLNSFNSNPIYNNFSSVQPNENLLQHACEMQVMALSLMQTASNLISAAQPTANIMSPYVNNFRSSFAPQTTFNDQSQQTHTPTQYNHNSQAYNVQRHYNYSSGRGGSYRWRGYGGHRWPPRQFRSRNNLQRLLSPRHPPVVAEPEIISLDSDDEEHNRQKSNFKRLAGNDVEIPFKKIQRPKFYGIINVSDDEDLSGEVLENIKIETETENSKNSLESSSPITSINDLKVEFKEEESSDAHNAVQSFEVEKVKKNIIIKAEQLKSEKDVNEVIANGNAVKEEPSGTEINPVIDTTTLEAKVKVELNSNKVLLKKENDEDMITKIEKLGNIPDVNSIEKQLNLGSEVIHIEDNTTELVDVPTEIVGQGSMFNNEKEGLVVSINEPTNWSQYKQFPELMEFNENLNEVEVIQPLLQQTSDLGTVLRSIQIFEPIQNCPEKGNKLKVSFDAYLPTDHFRKSLKILPKFRIIVTSSTHNLPSKFDIDTLKKDYEDGIPFLFAVVLEESIGFYMYDSVSLPIFDSEEV